jgi:ABC-type nitrate/sulfonate/bicarbonate transport system substrate-binding protein
MKNKRILIAAAILAVVALAYLLTNKSTTTDGKITIAEGSQPIAALIYIANEKGYFKDEGLNVELKPFATGKLCLDAVIGGGADYATVAETPIMHAAFSDQPIKVVATIHRAKENTFCIANKTKGINTPADLKGKTIAVPIGTNAEYALSKFLTANGLKSSDIKKVNLSPPEMIGPIAKGNVDAVVAWQPHIGRCEAALGKDGMRFSFASLYTETYNLVTNRILAEDKSDVTVKILKALDRANNFLHANPEESIGIVARRLGMDRVELEKIWPIYNFGLDLKPSLIDVLESEAQWAVDEGQHDKKDILMKNFVSTTALRKVLKDSVFIK